MNRVPCRPGSTCSSSGSSEDPAPARRASARDALLEKHGLSLPDAVQPGLECLFRFRLGEPLSLDDGLALSRWLRKQGADKIELLCHMQALESSFIPTLDLTVNTPPGDAPAPWHTPLADRLTHAIDNGLLFQVRINAHLPPALAQLLQVAMGLSRTVGLIYTSAEPPTSPATCDWLRKGLKHCESLQRLSGQAGFLPLLERGVADLELVVLEASPCTKALAAVLKRGDTRSFTMKTDSARLHLKAALLIRRLNAGLTPLRCVLKVEMRTFTAAPFHSLGQQVALRQAVQVLFNTHHLRDIVLPHPRWLQPVLPQYLMNQALKNDLRSLRFATPFRPTHPLGRADANANAADLATTIERLDALLQRKRQRDHLVLCAVAPRFASAATLQFKDDARASEPLRNAAGLSIDPLSQALVRHLQDTPAVSALAGVNKATAAAAHQALDGFDPGPPAVRPDLAVAVDAKPKKGRRPPRPPPDKCSVQ